MKQIQDYIIVVHNALDAKTCDKIITEYSDEVEWSKGMVRGANEGNDKTVRAVASEGRVCHFINISESITIGKNINIRAELDALVFNGVKKCITRYKKKIPRCSVDEDSGYGLLRYKKNGYIVEHTDSDKVIFRTLSCSFLLNDNFDGGEFAFFNRELKFKLKKGDAILFPSNFMYPHEVMPVIEGTRYAIITWLV